MNHHCFQNNFQTSLVESLAVFVPTHRHAVLKGTGSSNARSSPTNNTTSPRRKRLHTGHLGKDFSEKKGRKWKEKKYIWKWYQAHRGY